MMINTPVLSEAKALCFASIVNAITLLSTLAWNNVIQSLVQKYSIGPNTDNVNLNNTLYAVVVTVIVVTLQLYVFPIAAELLK